MILELDRPESQPILFGDVFVDACDCHAHIFAGAHEFMRHPGRHYDPVEDTLTGYVSRYQSLMLQCGLSRSVLVHSNVYGEDNAVTERALQMLGQLQHRGVALLNPENVERQVLTLSQAGFTATRLNLIAPGLLDIEGAKRIAPILRKNNWHFEILVNFAELVEEVAQFVKAVEVPVVIDHFGHIPASWGTDHPVFRSMLRLLRGGRTWLKLSAPYYLTSGLERTIYVEAIIRSLINENPDRLIWGSNWPHVNTEPNVPSTISLLGEFLANVGDKLLLEKILVKNPANLYGF